jgi:hypothetical protein
VAATIEAAGDLPFLEDVVVDRMLVEGEASAREFGARLMAAPRRATGTNAIAGVAPADQTLMSAMKAPLGFAPR